MEGGLVLSQFIGYFYCAIFQRKLSWKEKVVKYNAKTVIVCHNHVQYPVFRPLHAPVPKSPSKYARRYDWCCSLSLSSDKRVQSFSVLIWVFNRFCLIFYYIIITILTKFSWILFSWLILLVIKTNSTVICE